MLFFLYFLVLQNFTIQYFSFSCFLLFFVKIWTFNKKKFGKKFMCLYFECLLGIQKGIYMVPFLTCIMLVYFVVLRLSMDDFFFAFLILYIFSFFVFNIFCCKISVAETVTPYSQVNSSWYFFFHKNIQHTTNPQ